MNEADHADLLNKYLESVQGEAWCKYQVATTRDPRWATQGGINRLLVFESLFCGVRTVYGKDLDGNTDIEFGVTTLPQFKCRHGSMVIMNQAFLNEVADSLRL